jgi:uncharacterized protein (TIGR02246 family)
MENDFSKEDEKKVRLLYTKLLENWNNNNAADFAGLFTANGNTIGFDGSQMNGPPEIKKQLTEIFVSHKVASYISIVKEVRALSPTVFLLRAVAGMIPPGQSKINPATNAIQSLIAQKEQEEFRICLFQNTPAAFHRRPELAEQLTEELQKAVGNSKNQ